MHEAPPAAYGVRFARFLDPTERPGHDRIKSRIWRTFTMPITVQPLHPVFVAQITGVDLRETLDQPTVAAIENAINQHGVLVFPGQVITDEQQMAFSRRFGDLETTVKPYRTDFVPRLDPHVADISNLNHRNQITSQGRPAAAECAGQPAVALRQQLQACSGALFAAVGARDPGRGRRNPVRRHARRLGRPARGCRRAWTG